MSDHSDRASRYQHAVRIYRETAVWTARKLRMTYAQIARAEARAIAEKIDRETMRYRTMTIPTPNVRCPECGAGPAILADTHWRVADGQWEHCCSDPRFGVYNRALPIDDPGPSTVTRSSGGPGAVDSCK